MFTVLKRWVYTYEAQLEDLYMWDEATSDYFSVRRKDMGVSELLNTMCELAEVRLRIFWLEIKRDTVEVIAFS